jgi:hypothetical protein
MTRLNGVLEAQECVHDRPVDAGVDVKRGGDLRVEVVRQKEDVGCDRVNETSLEFWTRTLSVEQ